MLENYNSAFICDTLPSMVHCGKASDGKPFVSLTRTVGEEVMVISFLAALHTWNSQMKTKKLGNTV